jgi:hypothetical protein
MNSAVGEEAPQQPAWLVAALGVRFVDEEHLATAD